MDERMWDYFLEFFDNIYLFPDVEEAFECAPIDTEDFVKLITDALEKWRDMCG